MSIPSKKHYTNDLLLFRRPILFCMHISRTRMHVGRKEESTNLEFSNRASAACNARRRICRQASRTRNIVCRCAYC